jgi:hypothetical protein
MDRHANVHMSKYKFLVEDKVLVSKDFDNNINPKKLKLSSFFDNPTVVLEIVSNNQVRIAKENSEGEIISMFKIKKTK